MKVIAIIPARMASTRFPGKPLADILELPMIEHVRRRVSLSSLISRVLVATCDNEIFNAVTSHGGEAVMTADTYERCTDRVAEAALSLDADVIINVQGDEPLVRPEMLDSLLAPLSNERELACTNLMGEITNEKEFISSDVIKTVCDLEENAIYFSREPIPSASKAGNREIKKFKQLGIIAFRKDFLQRYTTLPPTPLEIAESIDMLRAVENGYKVRMVLAHSQVVGVDTPADLERARAFMKKDDLLNRYLKKE